MEELYSLEWFRTRARESLKKIKNGAWDFSDPLLLYAPSDGKEYEAVQQTDNSYYQLITKPEQEYLKNIAPRVVSELPEKFEYVELGPGTAQKEQIIFDEARHQHKEFIYMPVDISEHFLSLSADRALKQGIQIHPLRTPFEELGMKISGQKDFRLVSLLGLTYSNYAPAMVLSLLKSTAGKDGLVLIDLQVRDRVDMGEVRRVYKENLFDVVATKLQLLGLDMGKDVVTFGVDEEVRAWCELSHSTLELERVGVMPGDKLLVFQSLRPTKESLEMDIAAVFSSYTLFDTGESFIAALLKF
jgi:hypothetical protein